MQATKSRVLPSEFDPKLTRGSMPPKRRVINHTRVSPTTYVSRTGVLTFVQGSPYDPPKEDQGSLEEAVQGDQKGGEDDPTPIGGDETEHSDR